MGNKSGSCTIIQSPNASVPLSDDEEKLEALKKTLLRANTLLGLKQWDDAFNTAQEVLDLENSSIIAHEIQAAAVLHTSQPERYAGVIRAATRNCAALPHFQNIQFQIAAMAPAKARKLVSLMYSAWPDESMVRYLRAQFDRPTAANKSTRKLASLPENTTFDAAALKLALSGKKDSALEQLDSSINSQNPVLAERANEVMNIINGMPDRSDYMRPLLVDKGLEITQSEVSRSGTTVLYFNSLGLDLSHTFDLIDSHFAAADIASVFLRDHSHNVYVSGLNSIASDRKTTQAHLRSTLSALGTRRLVVVGRSGGGFGALQYGLELGADRIVCFSAPTNMTLDFLRAANDSRGPSLAARLNKKHAADDIKLTTLLPKSSAVSEGIHLHYGADMAIDRNHAEHIASAANVNLYPIKGSSAHSSFIHHLAKNNFLQLING